MSDAFLATVDAKTPLSLVALPGLRRWSGNRRRIFGSAASSCCLHIISRLTDNVPFFDHVEKEALARLLWKMAAFSGIRILTYCVMGNHFHALIYVPNKQLWLRRFEGPDGEQALFRHLATLYPADHIDRLQHELRLLRARGLHDDAARVIASFHKRFCDASLWTKEVKERFARWLNRRRERRGTVWMERYKSVLVQDGAALRTMAAYIDLNPVRAGLVADPAEYPWSGYAEATHGSNRPHGGRTAARLGLCRVLERDCAGDAEGAMPVGDAKTLDAAWESGDAGAQYRGWLLPYGLAPTNRATAQNTTENTASGAAERAPESVENATRKQTSLGKRVSLEAALRRKVRPLSDGMVLGERAWVEGWFRERRADFGKNRGSGARRLRGVDTHLCCLRDLKM